MSIRALREAVEAGETLTPHDFIRTDTPLLRKHATDAWLAQAYDMNAALALLKAVLPGWFPGVSQNIHTGLWYAWVQDFATAHYSATEADPARALLIAILKAMEAQEGEGC